MCAKHLTKNISLSVMAFVTLAALSVVTVTCRCAVAEMLGSTTLSSSITVGTSSSSVRSIQIRQIQVILLITK